MEGGKEMKKSFMFLSIILISFILLSSCELIVDEGANPKIHLVTVALDYIGSGYGSWDAPINDQTGIREEFKALTGAQSGYSFDEYYLSAKNRKAYVNSSEGATDIINATFSFKDKILAKLTSLSAEAKSTDLTVFFYSGHGIKTSSINDPEWGALFVGYKVSNTNALLSVKELHDALAAIPGKKLIILDSCYSGAYITDSESVVDSADFFSEGWNALFSEDDNARDNIWTLTASSASTESYVNNTTEFSYFTETLLAGLGYDTTNKVATTSSPIANGNDGKISLSKLFTYIKHHIGTSRQITSASRQIRDLVLFTSL